MSPTCFSVAARLFERELIFAAQFPGAIVGLGLVGQRLLRLEQRLELVEVLHHLLHLTHVLQGLRDVLAGLLLDAAQLLDLLVGRLLEVVHHAESIWRGPFGGELRCAICCDAALFSFVDSRMASACFFSVSCNSASTS